MIAPENEPRYNHSMNNIDTQYLKQFKSLTLELGRGETYCSNKPTLYGHSTYGRSSVLSGRPRRVFIDSWDSYEEARQELANAKVKYQDLCPNYGSTHIPVDVMIAGIRD